MDFKRCNMLWNILIRNSYRSLHERKDLFFFFSWTKITVLKMWSATLNCCFCKNRISQSDLFSLLRCYYYCCIHRFLFSIVDYRLWWPFGIVHLSYSLVQNTIQVLLVWQFDPYFCHSHSDLIIISLYKQNMVLILQKKIRIIIRHFSGLLIFDIFQIDKKKTCGLLAAYLLSFWLWNHYFKGKK